MLTVGFGRCGLAADDPESKFRAAVEHREYDAAIAFVRQGLESVDAEFEEGNSPLCLAASDESADGFDIVLELVNRGAP